MNPIGHTIKFIANMQSITRVIDIFDNSCIFLNNFYGKRIVSTCLSIIEWKYFDSRMDEISSHHLSVQRCFPSLDCLLGQVLIPVVINNDDYCPGRFFDLIIECFFLQLLSSRPSYDSNNEFLI